jgi:hypothetical protein
MLDLRHSEEDHVRGRESVVAVVDATPDNVIVWWANIGLQPDPTMGRLCGAWKLDLGSDEELESLIFKRIVLPTNAGSHALKLAGLNPDRILDVGATVAAAIAARDRCQDVFDDEQAQRGKRAPLRAPNWPSFPAPLDVENPPAWSAMNPSGADTDAALSIAHWLAALCTRWESLESERLGRPLLRELDGTAERPLPAALVAPS